MAYCLPAGTDQFIAQGYSGRDMKHRMSHKKTSRRLGKFSTPVLGSGICGLWFVSSLPIA